MEHKGGYKRKREHSPLTFNVSPEEASMLFAPPPPSDYSLEEEDEEDEKPSLFDNRTPMQRRREKEAIVAQKRLAQLFEAEEKIFRLARKIAMEKMLEFRAKEMNISYDGKVCSICTISCTEPVDESQSEHISVEICCGHHFHIKCITQWFNDNKTCPNCRKVILQ